MYLCNCFLLHNHSWCYAISSSLANKTISIFFIFFFPNNRAIIAFTQIQRYVVFFTMCEPLWYQNSKNVSGEIISCQIYVSQNITYFWWEILCIWITEKSQSAASESVIVKCISTLRIRFPKWDKNLPNSHCSPKSGRQWGYQPDPSTTRIHSVSQILLWHEMSQHISYKRDYPSLKVKEGGRGIIERK